ncbi:hypothetical protein BY458DRAFT_211590 [Sporodiniella umbellata]|nr:hypothetical protein BY458DRAFT_211590 [Sporodiniella umbellata]
MKQYWARRGGFSARDALLGKVPPSPTPKEKKQKTKRLLNREKKNVSYGTRSATDSNYVHRSLSRFKRLNTASYQRSIPDKIAMETPSADIPSPHVHTTPVSPPTTLERRPSKEDPWVLSRTLSQRTLISKEEEEDMDEEYEASDVIYQLDYRGDWDWPKDVLRLIKLQRSLSGELQALIRWKDGPVACYDTNYIKQRHPYLVNRTLFFFFFFFGLGGN